MLTTINVDNLNNNNSGGDTQKISYDADKDATYIKSKLIVHDYEMEMEMDIVYWLENLIQRVKTLEENNNTADNLDDVYAAKDHTHENTTAITYTAATEEEAQKTNIAGKVYVEGVTDELATAIQNASGGVTRTDLDDVYLTLDDLIQRVKVLEEKNTTS